MRSLRRRVTLTVLGLIAVLLLVVGVAVDLALGIQLRRDLHDRMVTTADRGTTLSKAGTPPAALLNQLAGGNIRIRIITPDGASYGDPAIDPNTTAGQHPTLPPPPPPTDDLRPPSSKPPPPDATSTVMVRNLPGHPAHARDRLVRLSDARGPRFGQRRTRIAGRAGPGPRPPGRSHLPPPRTRRSLPTHPAHHHPRPTPPQRSNQPGYCVAP
ncbi:MAG: hypothetical protein ACRDQU_18355 [Pseudonocardiaceae bacterium]